MLYLRSTRNLFFFYLFKRDLFPFVIFQKGKTGIHVYRAEVTFFNSNRRDGLFFFIIILCCIIGYCVISVSKGNNK